MADPTNPTTPDPNILDKVLEKMREQLKSQEDYLASKNREYQIQLKILEDGKASRAEILKFQLEQGSYIEKLKAEELLSLKRKKQLTDDEKKRVEDLKTELKITKDTREEIEEIVILTNQQYETTKKRLKAETDFGNSLQSSFTTLTKIGAQSTTLLGKLFQTVGAGANITRAFGDGLIKIKDIASFANLTAASMDLLIQKTIQLTMQFDKARATFEKQVGNVKFYDKEIEQLRYSLSRYSISVDEAFNITKDLASGFANFRNETDISRKVLEETTGRLMALGISTAEVVKNMDYLVKGLNMTTTAAAATQESLYATAIAMGLPSDRLIKDFAAATPLLAGYGKRMEAVFMGLQQTSQKTGIEFNRLTQYASRFRTFDEAASSAGQLNAILGGDYLNSIELLNATDEQKIKIMQESLKLTGRRIQDMSLEEQIAIQQALGLSDVADLQRLANQQTAEGRAETLSAERAQKIMNEAIQNAVELGKKWEQTLSRLFLALTPIVDKLKSVLDVINKWIEENGKLAAVIIPVITGISGLIAVILAFQTARTAMALPGMIKDVSTLAQSTNLATNATKNMDIVMNKFSMGPAKNLGSTLNNTASGMNATGKAAGASIGQILAFGAAIALVGAGIAAAAFGLATLVKAFKDVYSAGYALGAIGVVMGSFIAIMIVFGIAAAKMGIGLGIAAPGMLAFGGAIALVGAGILAASFGLSMLVNSFANLNPEQTAASVKALSIVMIGFAISMGILGIAAVLMGTNLAIAAPGILAFGGAIALIGLGVGLAAAALGYLFGNIANMFSSLKQFSTIKEGEISKPLNELFDSVTSLEAVAAMAAMDNLADSFKQFFNTINNFKNVKNTFASIFPAEEVNRISALAESFERLGNTFKLGFSDKLSVELLKVRQNIDAMDGFKISGLASISMSNVIPEMTAAVVSASTPATTLPTVIPAYNIPPIKTENVNKTQSSMPNNTINQNSVVPVSIVLDGKEVGKILGNYLLATDSKFTEKLLGKLKQA